MTETDYIDDVTFDDSGLIPAIAQDAESGEVLMVAFMNEAALRETVDTGRAVYWSRSRGQLWRKGEESGHHQEVDAIRMDCDGDVLVLSVRQTGGIACHTGRKSCFYRTLKGGKWETTEPVLKDPEEIYGRK